MVLKYCLKGRSKICFNTPLLNISTVIQFAFNKYYITDINFIIIIILCFGNYTLYRGKTTYLVFYAIQLQQIM